MGFFSITTTFLLRRLKRVDEKWESSISHKQYKDEPPFSDSEYLRYWWADTWRDEYHWLEGELQKQPEIRAGILNGIPRDDHTTYYEPTT